MRIGITVDMRHSMFSAGHPNSCIAICEAFQVGGHDIVFIKKDDKMWWDDVLEIAKDYIIKSIDDVSELDLLIEVAFHPTPLQRARIARKSVWYCRKSALFTDIESTIYACRVEGRNLEGVSEIWTSSMFNNTDDKEYLNTLYPSILICSVPWLWSSTIVEAHRKERQSPVWPQVIEKISKEVPWSLHIMETNASNTSSCSIPLLIIQNSGETMINVHNTELLSKCKFFNENIIGNCSLPEGVQLVGRQRTIDWSHEPKSIIISHSRFIPLKHANLEAVWVGIPLIHNNEILGELGCGLEDLYYNGNSIEGAKKVLKNFLDGPVNDSYMYKLDTLTELRKRILYKYSPEANAKEWLSLLEKKVVLLQRKKYRILFTDMWSEFNPEHNMFTLALQDFLKDYEVIGTSVVNGEYDVHIFGPFGSEWLSVNGSNKIHFTGENSGPIEHPSVKLNIGFRNLQKNYLRVPLWMFELDLFGADLSKIRNPFPLPLDVCRKSYTENRSKFCAFIVSNPKNQVRNDAFHVLTTYKPVDSAGSLFNNIGGKIFAGLGGGGGELKKHEFLKDYKFCLCYENDIGDGYVTEKLLHAKAAGCIPIYWGSSDAVKDFDPRGFIHITDPSQLITKVKEIDEDEEKWFQMASIPCLTDEKVSEVKSIFEQMCKEIVMPTDMLLVTSCTMNFLPSLERWLDSINKHRKFMPNLRARVFLASDISLEVVPKNEFTTYIRFPSKTPVDFPDFWQAQHFAWKLWLLNEVACDPFLKGSTVLYLDCGSVIIRWPSFWVEQAKKDKITFLEDSIQPNSRWCHKELCDYMKVTQEELKAKQLVAGLIMFRPGETFVMDFFKEALKLGSIRKIIVGKKWAGRGPDGEPFGHRHDQSILSILARRYTVGLINIDRIYNHVSARATFYGGQYIYVHRGDYKTHVPLLEGIDDAYVVNLDRRADRLKSFVDCHPYFKGKIRRHKAVDGLSLTLSPNICSLLNPNDFFWKKAVAGCALSHLKLWTMLFNDTKEIQSYLIMEDDARLKPNWSEAWSKVQNKLSSEWECVYLGGVLPPNREGFEKVLEETEIPGLCRIAPNTFFGQNVASRQFHFCTYAYVISRRGVQRVIEAIEEHKGIWTSADHILFNSLDKENVFVLNPLVAGASQDDDPVYLNSDFNDFSRIDKFDSDLWNNDERFNPIAINREVNLNIKETIDEVYNQRPRVEGRYVALDLCQITNETIYEGSWLKDILGNFNIEVVSMDTDLSVYNNLVIVIIRSKWNEQIEWINSICKSGKKFKILHFSDEFEQDPIFFYEYPQVTGVLRFYKRAELNNKILTIPLGYHWKNTFPIIPVDKRKYIVSFHGTDWKGRSEELAPLLSITPSNIQFYPDWRHPSQLDRDDYLDLLLNSIFVPCPRGNNIETFRFYEALECGCIPVFTELPEVLYNSGLPFLKCETWTKVLEAIEHLNANPAILLEYHKNLMNAWASYKDTLKKKATEWLMVV